MSAALPLTLALRDLEAHRRRGEIIRSMPDEIDDLRSGLAEVDLALAKLGYPSWHDVNAPFSDDNELSNEHCAALYPMHLERRFWLAASRGAPGGALTHGWRYVVGPTGEGVSAEIVLPARLVIINDRDRDAQGWPVAAWHKLARVAETAQLAGLDTVGLLGLDLATCVQALGDGVQS